jgi:hypothetical protein
LTSTWLEKTGLADKSKGSGKSNLLKLNSGQVQRSQFTATTEIGVKSDHSKDMLDFETLHNLPYEPNPPRNLPTPVYIPKLDRNTRHHKQVFVRDLELGTSFEPLEGALLHLKERGYNGSCQRVRPSDHATNRSRHELLNTIYDIYAGDERSMIGNIV